MNDIDIKRNLQALERIFYYMTKNLTDAPFPDLDYLGRGSPLSRFRLQLHTLHLQLFSLAPFVLRTIVDTLRTDLYLLYDHELAPDKHDPNWKTQCLFTAYILHRFIKGPYSRKSLIDVPKFQLTTDAMESSSEPVPDEARCAHETAETCDDATDTQEKLFEEAQANTSGERMVRPADAPLPTYLEYAFFCKLLSAHRQDLQAFLPTILKKFRCFALPLALLEGEEHIEEVYIHDYFAYCKIYNPILLMIYFLKEAKGLKIREIYTDVLYIILSTIKPNWECIDRNSLGTLYILWQHCRNQYYNTEIEACFEQMKKGDQYSSSSPATAWDIPLQDDLIIQAIIEKNLFEIFRYEKKQIVLNAYSDDYLHQLFGKKRKENMSMNPDENADLEYERSGYQFDFLFQLFDHKES
jgi:hypothetical protein